MSGTLSVIGTPIGNMEDISLRALRTMREADVIFCEDTRVTRNLCQKYEIDVPLRRLDAHMEMVKVDEVIAMLEEGKRVALVSDAGTPGISDPGSRIVNAVRTQLSHRLQSGKNETDALAKNTAEGTDMRDVVIEAIPGPSALTTLISISGMDCASFFFAGFSPHKKGRETFFREVLTRDGATVFYESPHRLVNALERIVALEPEREVCVGRELTKVYEEVRRGPASECLAWYTAHPPKGECVVIVSKAK